MIMSERQAMNEFEVAARRKLLEVAQAMIDQKMSFFEGAGNIFVLRHQIGGVSDVDPDFNAFVAIYSETDHLPYENQRDLWSPEALDKLEPEFKRTEEWAASFAPSACRNLIDRFKTEASNEYSPEKKATL
jgi:hypothetical protein